MLAAEASVWQERGRAVTTFPTLQLRSAWERRLLPTKGAGTEYGSLTAIEGRDEEFGFAFHRVEHVLVIGFAKGLHEVFASLGQTAEENEGFG